MPVLTTAQVHKLNLETMVDPQLLLVEFEELHSGFVHRHVRNNEDITSTVSDGSTSETWTAATIDFTWPGYSENIRDVNIEVSNVNRAPGRAMILSREPVMVRLIVIDYASPNVAMADTFDLLGVAEATIDAQTLSAKLTSNILWNLPVPFFRATKLLLPGIYA